MTMQTERVQSIEIDRHLTVNGVSYTELPRRARELAPKGTAPKATKAAPTEEVRARMKRAAKARTEKLEAARSTLYSLRRSAAGDARRVVRPDFLPLSVLKPGAINRTLNENKVVQIAGTFNWEGFVALAVQDDGDGTYTVLDGHHRFEAARRVWRGFGDPFVPCMIQAARGTVPAAEVVHDINAQRTAWTSVSLFWLRLDAEDATALGVVRVLGAFGLKPLPRTAAASTTPQAGEVGGIVALEQCAKKAGLASARHTVAALKAAYTNAPEAYRAPMIRGMWDFLLRYADTATYRGDVLVASLKATTPQALTTKAAANKRPQGPSEQSLMAQAIYDAYSIYLRAPGRQRLPRLPGFTFEGTPRAELVALNDRAKTYRLRHGDNGEAH